MFIGHFGVGLAAKKIDNKPAVEAYLNKMGWSEDLLDESMHRRTLFYPLCYEKGEILCPRVLALVIKDTLVFYYFTEK